MDGERIVKKLLPLIILLSGVAHAQIDDITLTGTADPLPNSTIPFTGLLPFSITFTVDTQSGTQSFQSCIAGGGHPAVPVCGFSAPNLTVTNASAQINGVAMPVGLRGSGFGSGPGGVIFSEFVIGNSINNFNWEVDVPTQGLTASVDSIFQQINTEFLAESPADRGRVHCCDDGFSSLDGYALNMMTISITHPTSVPEPGTLSLLTFAFVGLLVFHSRRRVHAAR
jgi:hypothetical protein